MYLGRYIFFSSSCKKVLTFFFAGHQQSRAVEVRVCSWLTDLLMRLHHWLCWCCSSEMNSHRPRSPHLRPQEAFKVAPLIDCLSLQIYSERGAATEYPAGPRHYPTTTCCCLRFIKLNICMYEWKGEQSVVGEITVLDDATSLLWTLLALERLDELETKIRKTLERHGALRSVYATILDHPILSIVYLLFIYMS